MTNQEAKSGNGTPRAPRYPENFSKFSIFSTPANQKTKKRYTLIKNKGTKSNTESFFKKPSKLNINLILDLPNYNASYRITCTKRTYYTLLVRLKIIFILMKCNYRASRASICIVI